MPKELTLTAGRWWGWTEVPALHPGWSSSPVFLTGVEPLKSGKGLLRLTFVHLLRPREAAMRQVELRVAHRAATHLVGTFKDVDGTPRTAVIAEPDFAWISGHCGLLFERRPPDVPTTFIGDEPLYEQDSVSYLTENFGRTMSEALAGAVPGSFGQRHPPMPERSGTVALNATAGPFDSWLIARGHIPRVMEDKWFVHREGKRLLFRRSWTGILIYDLGIAWHDDRLHLGQARVNRDPSEYEQTDDDHDRRLLMFLVDVLLRGVPHAYPHKADADAGTAALQAWSMAGKFSL